MILFEILHSGCKDGSAVKKINCSFTCHSSLQWFPKDIAASRLEPGAAGGQGEALAPRGGMEGLHRRNVLLLSPSVPSWMRSPNNSVVFSQQRRELYRPYLPMGIWKKYEEAKSLSQDQQVGQQQSRNMNIGLLRPMVVSWTLPREHALHSRAGCSAEAQPDNIMYNHFPSYAGAFHLWRLHICPVFNLVLNR